MSHTGNNFALTTRDRIVGQAVENDMASLSYLKGNNINAALYDFCGNLLLGAVPQTLMGFGIVIPYFTVLRQGWIGGIVSVDSQHKSRFKNFKSSAYYLLVLMLQFMPYSLAIGCGIRFGVDFYNNNRVNGWEFWKYKIQKSGIKIGDKVKTINGMYFTDYCDLMKFQANPQYDKLIVELQNGKQIELTKEKKY